MGNGDRLNVDIGKDMFDTLSIENEDDTTCLDNCELITKQYKNVY